ncbi:MAG: hypothetical protein ABI947_06760 [Chloroflexota bacterium]
MTKRVSDNKNDSSVIRYRPLGLLIAILATALIYGIGPLVPLAMVLIINLRGRNIIGADLGNLISGFNIVLAAVTLIVCVQAWIGRPRWSRWILIAIVWIASLSQLIGLVQPAKPSSTGIVGTDFSQFSQPVYICQLMIYVLVPLYITWYMNRAPARAFYRRDP